MEVLVGAVPQGLDAGRLGDRERFEQKRTLAPRTAGVHLHFLAVEPEAARDRGEHLTAERFQVLRREEPVVRALVRKNVARDIAPVERAAHRRESGPAIVAGRTLLVAEELWAGVARHGTV